MKPSPGVFVCLLFVISEKDTPCWSFPQVPSKTLPIRRQQTPTCLVPRAVLRGLSGIPGFPMHLTRSECWCYEFSPSVWNGIQVSGAILSCTHIQHPNKFPVVESRSMRRCPVPVTHRGGAHGPFLFMLGQGPAIHSDIYLQSTLRMKLMNKCNFLPAAARLAQRRSTFSCTAHLR